MGEDTINFIESVIKRMDGKGFTHNMFFSYEDATAGDEPIQPTSMEELHKGHAQNMDDRNVLVIEFTK